VLIFTKARNKENLTDGARHHQLKIDGIYSESKSWSFTLIKIVK
jgi:hypothetical protein